MMFPNSLIMITRLEEVGKTPLGSPITQEKVIIDNLKVCLLEDTESKLKNTINLGDAGQTTLSLYALSCNTFFDFQEKDTITVKGFLRTSNNDLNIGDKLFVFNHPYKGNLIPHVRVILRLGV